MNLIRTPEIKEFSSLRGRHANILLVKVIIALKWLLTSVPASDLFCDIFLIYSPFVQGLGFVMAQFRIAFIFLSTSSIRYGRKTSKNPSLSYSLKTQPIKKQTYLVSLPHLLDRSCHSRAGSWPRVAPPTPLLKPPRGISCLWFAFLSLRCIQWGGPHRHRSQDSSHPHIWVNYSNCQEQEVHTTFSSYVRGMVVRAKQPFRIRQSLRLDKKCNLFSYLILL